MVERLPKLNLEEFGKIKGLGGLYRASDTHYDEALDALKSVNAEPISLRDLAYARINYVKYNKKPENGIFFNNLKFLNTPFYVKEGMIDMYAHHYEPLFVSESPLLTCGRQLADKSLVEYFKDDRAALLNNPKEFQLNKEQVEKYLELAEQEKRRDPVTRKCLIVDLGNYYPSVSTNRFGEDELTLWAFKDMAEEYGLFLRELGVDKMPINLFLDRKKRSKSPVRQLFLEGILSEFSHYDIYNTKSKRGNSCLSNPFIIVDMCGAGEWHDENYIFPFGGVAK